MTIQPLETITSVAVTPLMQAMHAGNDQLPSNSLPTNTQGTVQENAEKQAKPAVTLYNAHGILTKDKPNTLLAYA